MRTALVLALLVAGTTAAAVPTELAHQGRMFDTTGLPIDGSHDVTVSLYDTPAGGTATWTESHSGVAFTEGYYELTLGETLPVDVDVVDVSSLHMTLSIDGGPELPTRITLRSVPYAILAGDADRAAQADHSTTADQATEAVTATNVAGGTVDATSILINGTTVIDASGAITATLPAHDHDASQITTGTLDILRLPIGTSADSVAAGDHVHNMSDLDIGPHTSDAAAHHAAYTDSDALSALSPHTGDAAAHHTAYTDSDALSALSPHTSDAAAHHAAYTDADAIAAVTGDCPSAGAPAAHGFCIWHIGGYNKTYRQAAAACAAAGGRLCATAEVESAWATGAQWCSWGWVANQVNNSTAHRMFPMQSASGGCGNSVSVIRSTAAMTATYGANCCK